MAHVQITTDADPTKLLGQTEAVDVDVVGIGEFIRGGADRIAQARHPANTGQSSSVENRLRKNVGGFAVVGAHRAVQPFG
ncbi:hypothetical protein D9M71_544650 [compost metagenome]